MTTLGEAGRNTSASSMQPAT